MGLVEPPVVHRVLRDTYWVEHAYSAGSVKPFNCDFRR